MNDSPRPTPGGCGLCGIEWRGHGRQYTEPAGWHSWQQPTQEQIKERMLAQRAGGSQMNDQPGDEQDVCRAAQYVGVPDTHNGAALCGCESCREYVAERDYEDEV